MRRAQDGEPAAFGRVVELHAELKDAVVPDHGPVKYHKTDVGFELRCQPGSADKPEVLQVGTAK